MDLFQWLTDTTEGKCLFTTLVSMIPIIELRGGIPFGVALGLPYWLAFPAAVIGNVIPAPFIIVYIRRIFAWMRRHLPRLNSGATSIWAFGSLWQFPCPEPAHGPALWWPPF